MRTFFLSFYMKKYLTESSYPCKTDVYFDKINLMAEKKYTKNKHHFNISFAQKLKCLNSNKTRFVSSHFGCL